MKDTVKSFLKRIYNKCKNICGNISLWSSPIRYRVRVMSSLRTIRYIIKNKCSVARYGDGELNMMLKGWSIGFQAADKELSKKLREVLKINNSQLLICLPHCFTRFAGENTSAKTFWKGFLEVNRQKIFEVLKESGKKNYYFGDTQMTRPYMDYEDHNHAAEIYAELKKLWEKRDVLIVEGEATRMGVGNDLFENAASLKRILCPAENAFRSYDIIKETILNIYSDEQILIALGPTATVLAAELSEHGIWALDVGHLDVEYEWYKMGAKEKGVIEGKYVNEASGGRKVDKCFDKDYLDQIVATIPG